MILLDTCALLWLLHDDPLLLERVAKTIEESEKAYLSIASLWEVAVKKTIKKLDIPETVKELEKKCEEKQIFILPKKQTTFFERALEQSGALFETNTKNRPTHIGQ